ncbi:tryparedoxin peroxidase, putative [Trichomonas vaginalis G3]|uniref:Tryparedoxin peroxidase, putative n=1 Tax=Trichomonas vaginalis (strain ATCC PRA-98 / G3) TaxID=412133 RepID=A2DXW7_TRIV3|nr:tryparedoxin peroxidase [Trichomonas vaginalis G3]EAY14703.1 tryparedoxin peroxidase, putative [Trichomonas vaginalis G3]KAI5487925.1 tryparedoxin peroxidase [Trichomonas vaginalis G3]|eukprot:XP_001326926.1 tryparedoxin peroxidase [Trichomonas vaginalis G3]
MLVGNKAPSFKAEAVFPDTDFKKVSLDSYKGKWLVLFAWPLDFTFVCPTEIIEFSNKFEEFKKLGCEVIGMSVDSNFTHLAWINTPRKDGGIGSLQYPIIGDLGAKISKAYGFYMEEAGHDLRGTVIIDPQGIVRHIQMNHPDVGRNVDEIIRLVKAYQFAAKHGEVCPAQWHGEGDLTIKADPKASKEYFNKANK